MRAKRPGGIAQEVEHLPGKCKALSSKKELEVLRFLLLYFNSKQGNPTNKAGRLVEKYFACNPFQRP
jgi:hypothetical protein